MPGTSQIDSARPDLNDLRGEQARMWTVLLDFSRSMGREMSLEVVLEKIVSTAAQLTCSRRVSLMLPDDDLEHLRIAEAIGIDMDTVQDVRLPIGEAVAGEAFASGERRVQTGLPDDDGRDYDGVSFVSMPILAATRSSKNKSVGVLNITHRFGDRPFAEWELEFIDLLGGIAGSVIDDTLWRKTRESLLKFERDLQVARRIQQSTFPRERPTVRGFEIDAFSEPAEETGGDTFDIIGYRRECGSGAIRLCTEDAERAIMLLADATGHGIGPALSVTQVRAMLRMAVRTEPNLAQIVTHMNDQLCADLPRGRFITAWLGELSERDHTLTCFSAGQAPILHYVAATDDFDQIRADMMPLGIVSDLDISIAAPIALEPGDMVAVISDGVFEAEDPEGREFGVDRVTEVIRELRDESPSRILAALRATVIDFVEGAPPSDDRTAIIVKRQS